MPRRLPKYCVEDIDRHGNVRIYLRRKNAPKVRIHGTPWTPAFMAEYQAALGGDAPAPGPRRTEPNTWKWLCQRYFAWMPASSGLEPRTQHVRRQILEATFDEPLKPGSRHTFGDMPLASFGTKAVKVLRDRKAATPAAANNRVKSIRAVFRFAIEAEIDGVDTNPATGIDKVKQRTDGFHTWTVDEVRQFMAVHKPGSTAYLAICLLLFTGVRRSDVVRLGSQHISKGWLTYRQAKHLQTEESTVDIPVLPILAQAIAATERVGVRTFLVTSFGKPFTSNGFGNKMRDWCDAAGLPHCASHGLRKAGATIAAENGATENQLMAIFGWRSANQVRTYTRKANRRKLAGEAMHLITLDGLENK